MAVPRFGTSEWAEYTSAESLVKLSNPYQPTYVSPCLSVPIPA